MIVAKLDVGRAEKLMEEIQQTLDGFTTETWATTHADAMPTRVIAFTSRLGFEAAVLQLICERYTEEPVDLSGGEDVGRTYNNPRHKICVRVARMFRSWGMTEWESTSDRVLARRVVDQVVEDLAREAYDEGVIRGAGKKLDGTDSAFERWWLNHE